jgi:hypothetical protein
MALLVKKIKEYEYIPLDFREDDKPFKIVFKPLTASQLASLEDNLIELNTSNNTMTIKAGTYDLNVLRYSILRWENVLDENGNPISLNVTNGIVSDDSLELIPITLRSELSGVISSVSKDIDNADLYLGTFKEDTNVETKKSTTTTKKAKSTASTK